MAVKRWYRPTVPLRLCHVACYLHFRVLCAEWLAHNIGIWHMANISISERQKRELMLGAKMGETGMLLFRMNHAHYTMLKAHRIGKANCRAGVFWTLAGPECKNCRVVPICIRFRGYPSQCEVLKTMHVVLVNLWKCIVSQHPVSLSVLHTSVMSKRFAIPLQSSQNDHSDSTKRGTGSNRHVGWGTGLGRRRGLGLSGRVGGTRGRAGSTGDGAGDSGRSTGSLRRDCTGDARESIGGVGGGFTGSSCGDALGAVDEGREGGLSLDHSGTLCVVVGRHGEAVGRIVS